MSFTRKILANGKEEISLSISSTKLAFVCFATTLAMIYQHGIIDFTTTLIAMILTTCYTVLYFAEFYVTAKQYRRVLFTLTGILILVDTIL